MGLTAALVVSGALIVGCSASPTPPPADGKISGTVTGIWDATFKKSLDPVIADFEKKYPGVKVDMNYQGGDVGGLVSTQLQAGTAPDILLSFPGGTPGSGSSVNVVTLASQGRLLDLSSSPWTKTVPGPWKNDVTYKGKTYAYPGIAQGMGAIYNVTTMKKLGLKVPTTLAEVYSLCAAAKKKGIYAYAQGLGEALAGPQMLSYAQTATLVYGPDSKANKETSDGTLDFAKAGWTTQFSIYKKMFDQGCFGDGALGRDRTQGGDAVAGGQALAIVDVSAVVGIMQTKAPSDDFLFTPMPATDNAKDTFATALLGYTLVVNAKAKNPAAAKAFLEFLSEPKEIAKHAAAFAALPAIPQAGYKAPAALTVFAKFIADGNFTHLPVWANSEAQPALNETVQSLLLGKDTVDSAVKKLQDVNNKGQG